MLEQILTCREQFTLQPRVAWYQSLLDLVPVIFVGHQNRIKKIVHLLTQAMALAFTEQGCGTPPWRSGDALLSKWLPKRVRFLTVKALQHLK